MLMLMGGFGFRLGKVENVGVEGQSGYVAICRSIAMGRRLHWHVSPDISVLNIGQIRRLEKKHAICDPRFLSLFRLKKHLSQNLQIFSNGAPYVSDKLWSIYAQKT